MGTTYSSWVAVKVRPEPARSTFTAPILCSLGGLVWSSGLAAMATSYQIPKNWRQASSQVSFLLSALLWSEGSTT